MKRTIDDLIRDAAANPQAAEERRQVHLMAQSIRTGRTSKLLRRRRVAYAYHDGCFEEITLTPDELAEVAELAKGAIECR